MKLPILFLAFLMATALIISVTAQSRASFGESCDKLLRCDSKASLTCSNGTCVCVKETEMTYDETRNKCVVLSGERCSYTAIEILTDQTQEKRYSERLDCVSGASCSSDGYCACDINSYETVEGLCAPKKRFNEKCTRDTECQAAINLICDSGKCSCNTTESVYAKETSKCVARAGVSCHKYLGCVGNAYPYSHSYSYCGYGKDDYRSICQCSGGFIRSDEGLCLGNYDSTCDPSSSPCVDKYSCINGACKCHFPTRQTFEGGKCLSHVNGPCVETVRGKEFEYQCRGQAECRNDTGISQCLCKPGYIKSVAGACKKAFGTTCSRDDECDQAAHTKLICKEGVCSCGDYQEYDKQLTRCVGLVGANCNRESICMAEAVCKTDRVGYGLCQCKPGMEVNFRRRCVPVKIERTGNQTEIEMAADEGIEAQENVIN